MNASEQLKLTAPRAHESAVRVTLVLTVLITWRGECWAYIDPNAGGAVAQIIAPLVAIVLSFLFYCRREIRKFIQSVRGKFTRIHSAGDVPESSPSPDRQ